ncbi:hypothetical protein [Halorarius litoreus]|uniref:hypothetical protein n=1 Tax=Halorarius litoreus TaxID=2962676 RepID=UPI0020CF854E|nr:hypothetical protein [Halorarius litoreus]
MVSRVQVAAAVTVLAVVGAGAAVVLDQPQTSSPADSVPATADYVGHLDTQPMRADENTTTASRQSLRFQSAVDFYSGPDFRRSYAFRDDGPKGAVHNVTYFGRANGSYQARIVHADWNTAALPAAIERAENVSLQQTTLHGRPAHVGDGYAVATLDDGRVILGNETAVRDALAVAAGVNASLSGSLRERFEATGGFARFAYRFEPETVPNYPFVGESIRRVEVVDGAYRRNGTRLLATTNVTVEDADTAGSVAAILDAGLTFYEFESSNASLKAELRKIRVQQDGRVVHARYESAPSNYPTLIRGLYRNQPQPQSDAEAAT